MLEAVIIQYVFSEI